MMTVATLPSLSVREQRAVDALVAQVQAGQGLTTRERDWLRQANLARQTRQAQCRIYAASDETKQQCAAFLRRHGFRTKLSEGVVLITF